MAFLARMLICITIIEKKCREKILVLKYKNKEVEI